MDKDNVYENLDPLISSRKRIKIIKTWIVVIVLTLLILPTILCIIMFYKVNSLQKQVDLLMVDSYGVTYDELGEKNSDMKVQSTFTNNNSLAEKQKSSEKEEYYSQYSFFDFTITKGQIGEILNNITASVNANKLNIKESQTLGQQSNSVLSEADMLEAEINKVGTDKAATDKAATDKAATDKTATDKAATDKAATDKSATDKAEIVKVETKKTEKKKVETKKTETKKVETKKTETKKAETTNVKNQNKDNKKANNKQKYLGKKVYITFDDGPSKYTDDILDVLSDYNVKATFFVIGKTDEDLKEIYKRIYDEGHTLGMHSYSHIYSEIYKSVEDFDKDFTKLSNLLYDTIGYRPTIFRFPGGSGNSVSKEDVSVFIKYLNEKSVVYYDWNVISGDATGKAFTVNELYQNVIKGVEVHNTSIVLMHDTDSKENTVKTLEKVLQKLTKEGADILPLNMKVTPIQQVKASSIEHNNK